MNSPGDLLVLEQRIASSWAALKPQLARAYDKHGRRLRQIVMALLIVLSSVLAAEVVWSVVLCFYALTWKPAPQTMDVSASTRKIDVDAIIATHLFGSFDTPVEVDGGTTQEVPVNLSLLGILAFSGESNLSRALIASDTDDARPYAVGSEVVAGVRVEAIFPDRVELIHNGKLEELRIDRDSVPLDSGTAVAANFTPSESIASTPTPKRIAAVRQQLASSTSAIQTYFVLLPNKTPNGYLHGFRIFPGQDRLLFNATGLFPGDVITSINGAELDDPAKSQQVMSELGKVESFSVGVDRGGQVQTIKINLRS